MRKYSNDNSCAKLLLKKSSGHLKISLIIFLLSITILMVIGLLYTRQYFQYEKDFLENVAIRTVYVDASFNENAVNSVTSTDVDIIEQALKVEFPNNSISVIPVYTCMGVYHNGSPASIFSIDERQCFFLDLEEILDDTVYFTNQQPKTIALEINVTKETENGFYSDEIKRLLLESSSGVSKNTPVLSTQNDYLTPSMREGLIGFVNMKTFNDIISNLLAQDIIDVNEVVNNTELVTISGLYVFVDDLNLVNSVSSFLMKLNYRAYTPTDSFDNFSETISVTFMVFLLSAFVLLCMTTVNIVLSFRSFYRVQQKDMGVLKYMGFSNKRIFRMYSKNLRNKFLQIQFICSIFVLVFGMFLFAFTHWIVLLSFIILLFVFLAIIFFAISRCVIYKYVKQEFLILIRESKEFE